MPVIKFTHKGWLGLCPVYVSNPDAEEPYIAGVAARHAALDPWLWVNDKLVRGLCWLFFSDKSFLIIGPKLSEPITLDV